jgi:plastocyanin
MRLRSDWLVLLASVTLVSCSDDDNGSPTEPPPAPSTVAVTVGNIFFQSDRNSTQNPALDTVAVGGAVTWTWVNTGSTPHNVESQGSPSFQSSTVQTGDGATYTLTFGTAGTYQYDCVVHGSAMSGTIVVR